MDNGKIREKLVAESQTFVARGAQGEPAACQGARMLQAMFNGISDSAFLMNANGTVLLANEAAAQCLRATVAEMVGQDIHHLVAPAVAERSRTYELEAIRTGLPIRFEDERDGRIFDNHIYPVFDESDGVASLVVFGREIINGREAEDALCHNEQLYRALAESTPQCVYVIDRNYTFRYANPAMCQTFNRAPDTLPGKALRDLLPEDVLANEMAALRCVFNSGQSASCDECFDFLPKPGWFETQFSPIKNEDGTVMAVLGVSRDVSERRRLELSERRRQEYFQALQKVQVRLATSRTVNRGALRDALQEITETVAALLNVARVSIWLFDEKRAFLRCYDLYEKDHDRHRNQSEIAVVDYPAYFEALERERALVAHDVLVQPQTQELLDSYLLPLGITSLLEAPIRLDGRSIGVVSLEHIGPARAWTEGEQEFAVSLADLVALVRERDERRRTRQQLDEQRTLLRTLLDSSPNLIIFKDRDSIVRIANQTYCAFLNRPMEEVIGKSVFDWFPEEFAWEYRNEDVQVMESGISLTRTREVPDPAGEMVWYEVIKQPLFDAQGQVIGLLSTERDITEKRRVEEERKESEARFQRVLEASNTGIWDWNIVTGEVYFSPRWKSILGYADHELENVWASWEENLHPNDRPYMVQEVADFLENPLGNFEREFRMRHKDGSYRWILNRSAALLNENGEPVRMSGSHLDVTARKEMEVALNNERQQLLALFDGIDEIIYVSDPDTCELLYVNDAFRRAWGKDVLGKPCYAAVQGLEAPCSFCTNDKIFGERVGQAHIWEFQNRTTGRWFRCADKAIRWSDGRWVRFELAADITDQKRAGEQLQRIAEDLVRSNAELQQFAYVASHDLQEPLRMISSYLQLLQRRYVGQLDEDADEFIHYAVDGAVRMQALINDLLTFSRVGTHGGSFKPTDAEAVLGQVLHDLRLAITEQGVTVTHDDLPIVVADRAQLGQLLQNLLGNAIKFGNAREPKVHIGVERRGDIWLFSVQDNGIGIDPKHFERIFQIFQRLHGRGEYPGTGLGLAICKKIVERHGGRIWVESQQGEGATFFFTLPVKGAVEHE